MYLKHRGGRSNSSRENTSRIPVRNPVTPSGMGFRAKFFSPKNKRLVRCESLLEFDCLHLFEFARGVVSFVEQPMTVHYRLGGVTRSYTPDFAVDWQDGRRYFVEVKPAERLAELQNEEKFGRLAAVFAAHGDQLVLLSEIQIRNVTRLRQVKRLLRCRLDAQLDMTPTHGTPATMTPRTIGEALSDGSTRPAILGQLATREISCCLEQEITDSTLLLPFEGRHDDALFI
ncbi:hypothetical protein R69746_07824 [Paraburkholderia aspalathi]|nr:hypothetical protein R69746_07824 [Paraburkholderia aspalathi]